MNPIGASNTWQWIPYNNSYAEVDGKKMPSVSGGTRWGGGVWINAWTWRGSAISGCAAASGATSRLIPPRLRQTRARPAKAKNSPDYGFLWWLNTRGGAKTLPTNSFQAQGAGSNTIFVSPDHDLVIVWRWHGNGKEEFFRQVIDAITPQTSQP